MFRYLSYRFPLLLGLLIFSSCVSKKKHLEAIQSLKDTHEARFTETTGKLNAQLRETRDSNLQMRLEIAERKGENNALVAMQDKLQGKIDGLKKELENQGLQSQSSAQSLNQEVKKREAEIARLQGLIDQIEGSLNKHLTTLGSLANDIRTAFAELPEDEYRIETSNVKVEITVSENLLFKPRTTTSVATSAEQVLEGIANTMQKYPSLDVTLTGHTDTKPPRNKGYKDNWTVSAVRAALMTRLLTEEYGLGTNQVLAAGKGEFAPRASNETTAGRATNRRIEFIIKPREEDMVRNLQRIIEEK